MKTPAHPLFLGSLLSLIAVPGAHAGVVTLTTTNTLASGLTSFNSGGGWSDGTAPGAGNTYVVDGVEIRTGAAATHVFGGDSLTLRNAYALTYKGAGAMTANLILEGNGTANASRINHAGTNALTLNGTIAASGSNEFFANNASITITSTLTGTGTLTLTGNASVDQRYIFFTGLSTFSGNFVIQNRGATFDTGSGLSFYIGASGVNNFITDNSATGSTYRSTFTLDLSSASLEGSWKLLSNAAGATNFFGAAFNVKDTSGNAWTEIDNVWYSPVESNGVAYTFTESTGTLAAVPEPAALSLLGLATALGMLRRRREALPFSNR